MKRQLEWRHCWCVAAILGFTLVADPALAQTRQEHVHDMGQNVMPFDLAKTMHIFRMTDIGGVQSVVVRDANARDQIALIQQHLQREAKAFQAGNYADPQRRFGGG